MRSVKVQDSVAEKVKDLKKHLRAREGLPVTEAEILSYAFELAFERRQDLIERLKRRKDAANDFRKFWLTPADAGAATDAARDHDAVRP